MTGAAGLNIGFHVEVGKNDNKKCLKVKTYCYMFLSVALLVTKAVSVPTRFSKPNNVSYLLTIS